MDELIRSIEESVKKATEEANTVLNLIGKYRDIIARRSALMRRIEEASEAELIIRYKNGLQSVTSICVPVVTLTHAELMAMVDAQVIAVASKLQELGKLILEPDTGLNDSK
jgi:hypothetical protein